MDICIYLYFKEAYIYAYLTVLFLLLLNFYSNLDI